MSYSVPVTEIDLFSTIVIRKTSLHSILQIDSLAHHALLLLFFKSLSSLASLNPRWHSLKICTLAGQNTPALQAKLSKEKCSPATHMFSYKCVHVFFFSFQVVAATNRVDILDPALLRSGLSSIIISLFFRFFFLCMLDVFTS